jgi:AcrR family transcriptional regulator
MSPRSKEQFEAIRSKSRKAILKAALKLFSRRGYAETTTADIARQVGISKGLIYNYFRSKEEILETLITESVRDALPALVTSTEHSDPRETMEELIHNWIHLIKSDSDLMRLVIQLHTSGAFRKIVQRKAGELHDMFALGIAGLLKRLGSSDPDLDSMLLGTVLDGISLNYTVAPDLFPIERIEKRLIEMYCSPQRSLP